MQEFTAFIAKGNKWIANIRLTPANKGKKNRANEQKKNCRKI